MENIKTYFTKLLPYLLATLFFIVFSYVYFGPILNGKDLPQMDQTHAIGMSKEIVDFKAKTGEETQWTNSMFGGMPAYQIAMGTSYNIYVYIQRILRLGLPYTTVAILFIYMFGFYLLLLSLKFSNLQSVLGGVAFGMTSYNIIIIAVGHITKTYAIAYMAPVIAGVLMTYHGKYVWGGILTTFALGVEIANNHIQIVYYLAIMVLLLVAVMFIYAIIEKKLKKFGIASLILVGAAIFAVVPNITNLATTYEYGKESIRGKSELTDDLANKSTGLDRDYAYAWSYGIGETWTLLIPNAKGGVSDLIVNDQELVKNIEPVYRDFFGKAEFTKYFGDQAFTAGPVYFGAIFIFLFVLGIFIVKGRIKWWLLASALLGIILSWGGSISGFTDFLFHNLPLYNKFRTLSMALVITGFAVALLGMFAVKTIIEKPEILKKEKIWLYISFGLTGGICLFFYFFPSTFGDFLSARDISLFKSLKVQQPDLVHQYSIASNELEGIRMNLFQADAIRSFVYILVAAALIFVYSITSFIKKEYLILGLTFLVILDLWTIDKRYLNSSQFVSKRVTKNQFEMTKADEVILKDVDPDYRVLSLMRSPFQDGFTPYFHKSIGGYHGAKLRRYQEIIDRYLAREIQAVANAYQKDTTGSINKELSSMNVINMLNTKYIIFGPEAMEVNWNALGHCWFVDDYSYAKDANEEIKLLGKFNPAKTAIIDERFKEKLKKLPAPEFFSLDTGHIELVSYKPNHLTYKSVTKRDRLAVFSEIYYDKGWNAYIDGFLTDHVRLDYILRGLLVPSGVHTIEFKFEPKTYINSQRIALASSIFIILLVLGITGVQLKKAKRTKELSEK